MKFLKKYTLNDVDQYLTRRDLEIKFGEAVGILNDKKDLSEHPQKYVLVGIPEDVGVRANYGRQGTAGSWEACLKSLCNMQSNTNTQANKLLILGTIDCDAEMEAAENMEDVVELGELLNSIDVKVAQVIETIVSAGKIPIVIGGGHNNSFGNIKGTSKALGKAINCVNLDTHSDFRPLEHRHSGNGFSYAKEEGYLNKYCVFGLHINYSSQQMLTRMEYKKVKAVLFEDMFVNEKKTFETAKKDIENTICNDAFGLEIDLDAIAMMGSSAMNPVGFTVPQARNFVYQFSKNKHCKYIHLCEGAPNFEVHPNQVGKVLAYLVTDILALASVAKTNH